MKNHELDTARAYIVGTLPQGEILAQLAEECTELAHATLKLRRALEGTKNPTPVDLPAAIVAAREEIADVRLVVQILELDSNPDEIEAIMARKLLRWADRLRNGKADEVLERAADETRY